MSYSYNQECLVSITVGRTDDPSVWHLPTFDPRNENKYHYPLHSLDIYFWTKKDAIQFVYGVQRLLPPTQVDIRDEPAPPAHRADPSAVVQQLEHLAVSDPTYHAPQPVPTQQYQQQHHQQQQQQPPLSAVSTEQQAPAAFVPMPYNPAAPAAPEQIRHREKTPPPDDGGLDPLAQAVAYDAQAPFSPGFVPPPGFQSGQQPLASPGLPGPPSALGPGPGPGPGPGIQRSATMPVHTQTSTPGFSGFQLPPPPPPGGPPQHQQQHTTQTTTPPSSQASPVPPAASAPPGGFSNYSYTQQQPQPAANAAAYSIHSSFYTPTEAEADKYKDYNKGKEGPKKLEENFGRVERGVSGMLKRFEKKFG